MDEYLHYEGILGSIWKAMEHISEIFARYDITDYTHIPLKELETLWQPNAT